MKIYIVKSIWSYTGCPDNYSNCYEESIEKIFDSEEKAIEYIRKCIQEKLGTICLETVPTAEELKESHEIEYDEEWDEHMSFQYEIHDVE